MTSELRRAVFVAVDIVNAAELPNAIAVIEADREAVRAEQAAEVVRLRKLIEATSAHFLRLNIDHPIMWEGAIDAAMEAVCLEVEQQAAELAKWKALAETLAGALGEVVDHCANDGRGNPIVNERIVDRCDETAREALTSYKEQRDD